MVVPYSHNEPGWLRTFEHYYAYLTKHIFESMIAKLGNHPGRKFIWTEVSFLNYWWKQASESSKTAIRQ